MGEKIHKEMVGYPVNRGVDQYADVFGMTRDGLLNWLRDKNMVLDVSSGGGLLRKEIDILKSQGSFVSNVKIVPLDIIYATKKGFEFAKYATHLAFTHLGVTPTKNFISRIDESFAKDAVGGSFTDHPFPNMSFDAVLVSYGFGIHAKSKSQMLSAYDEVYRLLKPGGEALVSVIFDMNRGVFSNYNKERSFIYTIDDLLIPDIRLKRSGSHFYLRIRRPIN